MQSGSRNPALCWWRLLGATFIGAIGLGFWLDAVGDVLSLEPEFQAVRELSYQYVVGPAFSNTHWVEQFARVNLEVGWAEWFYHYIWLTIHFVAGALLLLAPSAIGDGSLSGFAPRKTDKSTPASSKPFGVLDPVLRPLAFALVGLAAVVMAMFIMFPITLIAACFVLLSAIIRFRVSDFAVRIFLVQAPAFALFGFALANIVTKLVRTFF